LGMYCVNEICMLSCSQCAPCLAHASNVFVFLSFLCLCPGALPTGANVNVG